MGVLELTTVAVEVVKLLLLLEIVTTGEVVENQEGTLGSNATSESPSLSPESLVLPQLG